MKHHLIRFAGLWVLGMLFLSSCEKFETEYSLNEDAGMAQENLKTNTSRAYYYYFDEKVYVNQLTDKIFIQFTDSEHRADFKRKKLSSVSSLQQFNSVSKNRTIQDEDESTILVLQSAAGEVSSQLLSEIEAEDGVAGVSYLSGEPGGYFAPLNQFIAKLKKGSSRDRIIRLIEEYGCEYHFNKVFGEDIFIIEKPKGSKLDIYELSSLFQESGLFEFSAPDFIQFDALSSNDPYYSSQWGLKNTGQYGTAGIDINIEQAWAITEGSPDIKVAVIDTGVDYNHPDLQANLLLGYDALKQESGGAGFYSHGTSVAGIIAATANNQIGVSGVAPQCKILPIVISKSQSITAEIAADGIDWAWQNGADVINCSWGFLGHVPVIDQAIYNATVSGRGGKGCVVTVGSGNDGANYVRFPSRNAGVLSVGAISYYGQRKIQGIADDIEPWGSNYGHELDVVAPGSTIATTTLTGLNGGYDFSFYGTSAATPFVSGIAALILSKYPDLTDEQVRRAIELSCTKTGGYTYTSDGQYPAESRNNEVGYGLVNAYYALQQAAQLHHQNELDAIPGFDYIITNNSSYFLDDIYVEMNGNISGHTNYLVTSDPGGVYPEGVAGYPLYRGETIKNATPGTTISNISLNFYATCLDYSGNVRIGVSIDNPNPLHYYSFAFDTGNTYTITLPNSTVPNGSRRMLYINIINNY